MYTKICGVYNPNFPLYITYKLTMTWFYWYSYDKLYVNYCTKFNHLIKPSEFSILDAYWKRNWNRYRTYRQSRTNQRKGGRKRRNTSPATTTHIFWKTNVTEKPFQTCNWLICNILYLTIFFLGTMKKLRKIIRYKEDLYCIWCWHSEVEFDYLSWMYNNLIYFVLFLINEVCLFYKIK